MIHYSLFYESNFLTLSRWRPLSYRNQSIDLRSKSMDWFLYDNSLRLERVKRMEAEIPQKIERNYEQIEAVIEPKCDCFSEYHQ